MQDAPKELICAGLERNEIKGPAKSKSRLYSIWNGMMHRCKNPKRIAFKYYGGRGISVCGRWHEFDNFAEDMGNPPTPQHTLDRFPNNDGNYEPKNCRWATAKEQARNNRHNVIVEIGGVKKCVKEWADQFGISQFTVYDRVNKELSSGEDLFNPERIRTRVWTERLSRGVAWCGRCMLEKPVSEFSKNRSHHTGLQGSCKEFNSEMKRGEQLPKQTRV